KKAYSLLDSIVEKDSINFNSPFTELLVFNKNYQSYWIDEKTIVKLNNGIWDSVGYVSKLSQKKYNLNMYGNEFIVDKNGFIYNKIDSKFESPIGIFFNKKEINNK